MGSRPGSGLRVPDRPPASSRYPAARNAIPVMIIEIEIVSHGLLPPTSAATKCVQLATGPYTEGA